MIEFRETMDQHSREIYRENKFLGFLLWHPEKAPYVSWHKDIILDVTLKDMLHVIEEYQRITGRKVSVA